MVDKVRVGFRSLFYFPGTFAHELLHYIGFRLMGFRGLSLSLLPKATSTQEIIMGSVSASLAEDKTRLRGFVPAILPKLWWIALYYLLTYIGWVEVVYVEGYKGIFLNLEAMDFSDATTYLMLYITLQLFYAGGLSFQDWKTAFAAIFSLYGLSILSLGVLAAIYSGVLA